MTANDERSRILDMLDKGIITPEQAIQLLASVEDDGDEEEAPSLGMAVTEDEAVDLDVQAAGTPAPESRFTYAAEPVTANATANAQAPTPEPVFSEPEDAPEPEPVKEEPPFDAGQAGWKNWWQWPLWIGVSITVIAAGFMYLAYRGSGFGFWFACTWFPFLFGVMLMALAWASRTARWVHVRVQQKPGEKPERIAISLPIPLRLTAWALRTFQHKIPGMDKFNAPDMITALRNVTPEAPLYVKVDEGEDGEKVEVYIG